MTGRELISRICESCVSLDAEMPIEIVHRDSRDGTVRQKQVVTESCFINGKLKLEGIGIENPTTY